MNFDGTNLGIGTASPGVRLTTVTQTPSSGPTLGSGTVGGQALLASNGLYGQYSGVSNNGDVWHQVQRNNANTAVYNMIFQPSGGLVGIGTIAPISNGGTSAGLLHINGQNTWAATHYTNTSTGAGTGDGGVIAQIGTNLEIFNYEAGEVRLSSNNTRAITIDSSQNVGIGVTSSLSEKLVVNGNISGSGDLYIDGAIFDSSTSSGTNGQVLSSTVTGTDWIDNTTGAVTVINNNATLRVLTATGTSAIDAETDFTWDPTLYNLRAGRNNDLGLGFSTDTATVGGRDNIITTLANAAAIVGGQYNTGSSSHTFIGGGCKNSVTGLRSAIIGGQQNTIDNHADSFIIGSCITTLKECTTFVNNISYYAQVDQTIKLGASETSGENIFIGTGSVSAGNVYYLREQASQTMWNLAVGTTEGVFSTNMLGIAVGTGTAESVGMLVRGFARYATTFDITNGIPGRPLYLSATTQGRIHTAAPSGSGEVVRILGYLVDDAQEMIYFNPDNTWVTL